MRESTEELARAARAAQANAHAPYSGFRVGAAVRSEDGRIFVGANVENASYGLSMCAERVAVGNAVAAGSRTIVEIVVVSDADPGAAPCGACRQVLHEFGADIVVTAVGPGGVRSWRLAELFPAPFGEADLWTIDPVTPKRDQR